MELIFFKKKQTPKHLELITPVHEAGSLAEFLFSCQTRTLTTHVEHFTFVQCVQLCPSLAV